MKHVLFQSARVIVGAVTLIACLSLNTTEQAYKPAPKYRAWGLCMKAKTVHGETVIYSEPDSFWAYKK